MSRKLRARALGIVDRFRRPERLIEVVRRQIAEEEPDVDRARLSRMIRLRRWQHPTWTRASERPPSSSSDTSSPVTVLTTSGPVMNMCDASRTMKMKSVMAGAVHRAASARSEDHADLGDDTRCLHVATEDSAVRVEADHAFLDARSGAVVESDHGGTDVWPRDPSPCGSSRRRPRRALHRRR